MRRGLTLGLVELELDPSDEFASVFESNILIPRVGVPVGLPSVVGRVFEGEVDFIGDLERLEAEIGFGFSSPSS